MMFSETIKINGIIYHSNYLCSCRRCRIGTQCHRLVFHFFMFGLFLPLLWLFNVAIMLTMMTQYKQAAQYSEEACYSERERDNEMFQPLRESADLEAIKKTEVLDYTYLRTVKHRDDSSHTYHDEIYKHISRYGYMSSLGLSIYLVFGIGLYLVLCQSNY